MSVVSVQAIDTWMEPNAEGHRVYKMVWEVITDNVNDGPVTVYGATGYPATGSYYQWNSDVDLYSYMDPIPGIKLRNVKGTRKIWRVIFTFTTKERERCQTTDIELPTAEPWGVSGDSQEWTEEAQEATDGAILANSSMEPFTGKLTEIFRSRRGLTLSKNLETLDQDLIDAAQGSVNSVAITLLGKTYAARTLHMRKITFTRKRFGVCGFYYPHSYVIDTNSDTFDLQLRDKGRKHYVGGASGDTTDPLNYEDIKQSTGDPIRDPIPLDGYGGVLTGSTASSVKLVFRVYKEYNWTTLGFPTTV